jgi:dihydrolipoamide dehydrogenase
VFKSSVFKDKLACYSLVDGVKTPLDRLWFELRIKN